jgi:putative iron-only hydrogenase system regulator
MPSGKAGRSTHRADRAAFRQEGRFCVIAARFLRIRNKSMTMEQNRLGTVGIVVEEPSSVAEINSILHQYADIIVGRLGIPYRSRGVSIISLAVDGSMDAISGMTGRLGKLPGVSVKAAISKR